MLENAAAVDGADDDVGSVAAILAFAGSCRTGSFNQRLLDLAVEHAISLGADVSVLDLGDLDLPIYDRDLEAEGMPQDALILRQMLAAHDGLLIACPEYNGSLPPLLKNALDWSSRPGFGPDGLEPYRGKPASIMSASVGPFGGARGLGHLRAVLSAMGALVLPDEFSLPLADTAFDETGLRDAGIRSLLERQVAHLVQALRISAAAASDP